MKHLLLAMLCLSSTLFSSAQTLFIKGKITDTDTVLVVLRSITRSDTAYTTNGEFQISRQIPSPELFTLICIKSRQSIEAFKENNERKMRSKEDGVSRELFLEKGEVILTSSFATIKSVLIKLTHHNAQDQYDSFKKRFNPLVKVARTIIDSSYHPQRSASEKKVFDLLYKRVLEIENEVAEQFVRENSDNAVGAYILYRYGRMDNFQQLKALYQLFNPALQATTYLKNIKEKLNALAILKQGNITADFSVRDHNNKPIRLSDFKGKYVVLDFWGSWCAPCINGFPMMKDYYKKYHDKVEFIGIACNDQDSTWREAIRKNGLSWPQLFNTSGNMDIAAQYNVEAYPTKILLDKDGKLIEIFIGESAGFYQRLDALFK